MISCVRELKIGNCSSKFLVQLASALTPAAVIQVSFAKEKNQLKRCLIWFAKHPILKKTLCL